MQTQIKVSVITDPGGNHVARVRKVRVDGIRLIGKWALSRSGKWIKVVGGIWPDIAKLEVMIGKAVPEEDDDRR